MVEHRLGTIVALLDENYETLVRELAKKLPQGREGQAVVWRIKGNTNLATPENLFIRSNVDRQDLIGNIRKFMYVESYIHIYLENCFKV